jgi:hypothetical protein
LDFAKVVRITGGESIFERQTGSLSGGGFSLVVGKLAGEDSKIASLEE